MPHAGLTLTFLLLLLLALSIPTRAQAITDCSGTAQQVQQTAAFLQRLSDKGLLGATLALHYKDCGFVFEQAYGYSVPELKVAMQPQVAVPIASNTKFYTAIGLWQLQQQGLLDIDAPVVQYMSPADFGKTKQWCPRVHGSKSDKCVVPSVRQLLFMGSGLIDLDNCDYADDGAWQLKYCDLFSWAPVFFNEDQLYSPTSPSPAAAFAAMGYWDLPLEYKPGTGHTYVNANFLLGAYIIEKVSGMPYAAYLRENIFIPAGLKSTSYDIAYGYNGIIPDVLPNLGYRSIISPVSPEYVASVANTTTRATQGLTQVPIGQVADLARNYDQVDTVGWVGGDGGIYATPRDVITFWHTVLFNPEVLKLTQDTVRQLLTSYNPHSKDEWFTGYVFAQGIVVALDPSYQPYGISGLSYEGGYGGVDSPFDLTFLSPDSGRLEDTVTLGMVYFATPELQVDWDVESCEVTSPWGDEQTAVLDDDTCQALDPDLGMYWLVYDELDQIWGLTGDEVERKRASRPRARVVGDGGGSENDAGGLSGGMATGRDAEGPVRRRRQAVRLKRRRRG